MADENGDNKMAIEDMEPEISDMMESAGALADEGSIDINDQSNSKNGIGDEESADKSTGHSNEGGILSRNSDIPDEKFGKSPSSDGIDFAGQLSTNPTAVVVGQNHKFTVRSRYRRASTGSCHDFCKFGHKHEPEKKTKRPLLGTIKETRPLMRTASGDNIVKSVPDKETKNKPLLRRLSLPGPISAKDPSTLSEDNNASKKTSTIQSKMKQVQSEKKPVSVVTPGKSGSRIKIDIPDVTKPAVQTANSQEKLNHKVKETKTKEEVSSKRKGEKEKGKGAMINSPRTALKKSPSIKALLVKNLKSFSRSRHHSNSEESKFNRSNAVPEKIANVSEPNDKKLAEKASKSSLSSEKAPNFLSGSRFAKNKVVEGNLKGSQSGLLSSSTSTAEETSRLGGETKKKSGSLSTKQNGIIPEDGGSKTTTPRAKPNVNNKAKVKKTGVTHPEEKDGSAWKVKFRRGTVLNLQVASNSPKKLRFKRGRVLGEDQSSKAEAATSLKSNDDLTESPHTKPEPEKVRLRRQEASAKKDSVDLNNVIEETASKLVKTRKSKVKALVGAFETVMSFRDRKPLVETSAS